MYPNVELTPMVVSDTNPILKPSNHGHSFVPRTKIQITQPSTKDFSTSEIIAGVMSASPAVYFATTVLLEVHFRNVRHVYSPPASKW